MAGFGTRLRPHTWSKPKPMMPIAGKTVLDYVLDQFASLPDPQNVEYVFIVGPNSQRIQEHMHANYPDVTVHFVVQTVMRGQSDALYLAREYLSGGPMLMAFSDTLIEADFSFLKDEKADGVALVKPVPDPRRFGVAEVNAEGRITHFVEKPQSMDNNLALAGFYYFRRGEDLMQAIEEQMARKMSLKNEYFLADAINVLLEKGVYFRPEIIETWLDAGVPDTVLETNRYLLDHRQHNSAEAAQRPGVVINPPVFVHPSAEIVNAVIGPHASIGAGCHIEDSVVRNSVLGNNTRVTRMVLEASLLGDTVQATGQVAHLNLGDHSVME
ncbi:MAG: sugar phosphate nucleotidyltransferase [Anaerolineaceae bacterium]|nr:sugar phosphate nucleotidyltransferase [Anaerolineaceae bacterium]